MIILFIHTLVFRTWLWHQTGLDWGAHWILLTEHLSRVHSVVSAHCSHSSLADRRSPPPGCSGPCMELGCPLWVLYFQQNSVFHSGYPHTSQCQCLQGVFKPSSSRLHAIFKPPSSSLQMLQFLCFIFSRRHFHPLINLWNTTWNYYFVISKCI